MMDEKELKELMEGISAKNAEAIREAVNKACEGFIRVDELEKKLADYGVSADAINNLVNAVEKHGLELMQLRESREQRAKSLPDILVEKREAFKAIDSTGRGTVRFTVKADITRGSITGSTLAQRDTEIGELPTLQPQLMPLFSRGTVAPNNNGVIRYVEQTSFTNAAAPVTEGTAKPESAATWAEKLARIETIAHWVPVTRQALNDLDFMASEIDELLRLYLSLKVDQQLYSGTGTSPELRGVFTAAPTFTPNAGTTSDPNIYDLIMAVASQITDNKDRLYAPSVALLNPADVLRYQLKKGTDNHYVLPPFVTSDGRTIGGIQVIPTARVTANTLLVGDFRYGRVYQDGDVTVEVGLIDNQFVKNMVTMLAEIRLCLLIKDVNASAFMKVTDISAALAAMD